MEITWLHRLWPVLSALLFFSPLASAAPCDTGDAAGLVRKFGPIRYGPNAETNLLNMFTPTSAHLSSLRLSRAAAILVIHGHGATYNEPDFTTICEKMAINGIACASIEYPVADGIHVFVWDEYASVNCALRWLRANGARFNYGTSAIGVYGVSLGGLQAMWQVATQAMTTTPHLHKSVIERDCPNAGSAAGVDAAIIQYGQADLTLPGAPASNPDLLGANADNMTYQIEFSPLSYLTTVIPQVVSVGNYDTAVNPANTGEWVRRLITLGARDIYVDPRSESSCSVGAICGGPFSGRSQYWLFGGFGHGYELFGDHPNPPNNLVVPSTYDCAAVTFFRRMLSRPRRRAKTAESGAPPVDQSLPLLPEQ